MKKILSVLIVLTGFITNAQEEFGDGIYAVFKTSKGEIIAKLEHEKAPMTVANFVALAEGEMSFNDVEITEPYFDGLTFHRVIKDFMIQGGDPSGTGSGGPGYKFPDEFDTSLYHTGPGVLSMANSGPNTNGSQFFITHKATPWLNGKHSVFGRVVKGQEVVDAIEQGDVMESVKIVRVGKEARKFKASKVFNEKVASAEEDKKEKLESRKKAFKEKWMETYPGMAQTESGLMYMHTTIGNGDTPKPGDQIQIHYTGYKEDGTKFESSHDRQNQLMLIMGKGQMLKGWEEAFAMMKPGGVMKIVLPPWLGFGAQGKGSIPPNAELIFDLELIDVVDIEAEMKEKNEAFKEKILLEYPNATQTKSGLMYEIIEEGNGSNPIPGQQVEVHYTGYLLDGTKFDSSRDRDQTFTFPLGQSKVIKGWDEGIQYCKVGGKIKLIIPYWLAYGEQGRPPTIPGKSHLIFDVEVIGVK
ncbi:MAG: FKBP-type peptidyl-prolyl cis-trans isomerase [Crocinitomicaceae bacterium]|nr:FKBP-type peptidyl-prolyl cis-trans isomerase [Crocinitomicaceae bacterium]